MISSGAQVSCSPPVSVTKKLFSMPTAPMPGSTNFGSKAKTMPACNASFERGVSTGSSLI